VPIPASEAPDPRELFSKPPFPQGKQAGSGSAAELDPPADYGGITYKGYGRLTGRVALITGGDSGIGRAVALCFAKEGADILISSFAGDADEERDAKETVRLVEAVGRKAFSYPGDIQLKTYCTELVDYAIEKFGRLDILVNNAGFQRTYGQLADIPEDEFDRTFRTNVYGAFFLTQAAYAVMKPGGVIINSCSIQAFEPGEELAPYAATKAALISLTKSLAKMCMKGGVRVNGVAPGPVWTPLIPATMTLEKVQNFGEATVFKRPAQPSELAALYVFLATDEASYVAGEIFGATGGRSHL
jgi:NAD(P)-dependent dehydrogenase (short-subunit alcohol dehydrogenase family)